VLFSVRTGDVLALKLLNKGVRYTRCMFVLKICNEFKGRFWYFLFCFLFCFCNKWYLTTITDDDRKFFRRLSFGNLQCMAPNFWLLISVDSVGSIAVDQRFLRVWVLWLRLYQTRIFLRFH